jgi:hypothetical protein
VPEPRFGQPDGDLRPQPITSSQVGKELGGNLETKSASKQGRGEIARVKPGE